MERHHERPDTAPPPPAKRLCTGSVDGNNNDDNNDKVQRTSPRRVAADTDDDAAFWLAAAQETSAIVGHVRAKSQPPPHPSASQAPIRTGNAPPCGARTSAHPTGQQALGANMRTRAPTTIAPVSNTVRPVATPARRTGPMAPPCLFGTSPVPRVRPHMASPDDPDDGLPAVAADSRHRASQMSLPSLSSSSQYQRQPIRQANAGPPVLFSTPKALPPPVITPYVPPSPSSSSPSSSPFSSSSSLSSSNARPGHDVAHENVCCKCAANTRETITGVTGRGNNAGRRYYKCPQFKQTGGCDFWLWHDEHGKARAAPVRDPRAPHYREQLSHDLLYASGGRTAERLVVLARQAAQAAAAGPEALAADAATSASAWIEAVTDRWHVTRPVATDPTETEAEGIARRMPLVDLDLPLGETARVARHPHVARQIACTALLSHMLAIRGWRVVVQPPLMGFYHHVHLHIARGAYDKTSYWVRVEPAQRLDPRDPPDTPVQYDSLWVQTTGPDPDAPGWLTGSHVDVVAFEIADGFLLIDRRRLWRYVDRHVVGASASASSANAEARNAATVTDPTQANHKLLDMGAVGQSPHERRTLISLDTLYQHEDTLGPDEVDKHVIQEFMPFDAAIIGPYFERIGRPVPPAAAADDAKETPTVADGAANGSTLPVQDEAVAKPS